MTSIEVIVLTLPVPISIGLVEFADRPVVGDVVVVDSTRYAASGRILTPGRAISCVIHEIRHYICTADPKHPYANRMTAYLVELSQ